MHSGFGVGFLLGVSSWGGGLKGVFPTGGLRTRDLFGLFLIGGFLGFGNVFCFSVVYSQP